MNPQENRLLHWTVEHPDDIARSNFLRGDHAHFFTNLDRVRSAVYKTQFQGSINPFDVCATSDLVFTATGTPEVARVIETWPFSC